MTLETNVLEFLKIAEGHYGRARGEQFSQEMWSNCTGDLELGSPIEKLLWIAVHTICCMHYIDVNPDPIQVGGKDQPGWGLHFWPQRRIGKYRVDFHAQYLLPNRVQPEWVIECDGHAFHERNKHERQYEKARDRFLAVKGYKILHFTGSEIVKDPYTPASELLVAVIGDATMPTPSEYWGD